MLFCIFALYFDYSSVPRITAVIIANIAASIALFQLGVLIYKGVQKVCAYCHRNKKEEKTD